MKFIKINFTRIVIAKVLMIIFLIFVISCKKNSTEPTIEYYDIQWIWLGEKTTYVRDYGDHPGIVRKGSVYYRGDKPNAPSSFFQNDVDWVSYWDYKCKWIHYYEDDGYIEFEVIGEDELESLDVSDYLIVYRKTI